MQKKSFKKNVILSYSGQFFTILTSFLFLPILMKKLGAEGYGLIGFYSMLQVWFMFLDFGLSPATSRETSRFYSNGITKEDYEQKIRALSFLFWSITIIGTIALLISVPFIQSSWLKINDLEARDVFISLVVISFSVTLRWQGGLYRGIITGVEQFAWLSYFGVVSSALRFIGVFPFLNYAGYTVKNYFIYQFIVIIIEFLLLLNKATKITGKIFSVLSILKFKMNDFSGLSGLLKFSSTFALGTFFWLFINQSDKLFLSGILSLKDYGYFALAISIANGVATLPTPIMSVIMPRMAVLFISNDHEQLKEVYRFATQIVSVLVGSATITLLFSAHAFLYLWTGSLEVADKSSLVLQIYVAANFLSALTAFSFSYQYAIGNMKLNLIGSIGQAIVFCCMFFYATSRWGAVGSGSALFIANLLNLSIWVPYTFKKLKFKILSEWFSKDIILILLPSYLGCYLVSKIVNLEDMTREGALKEVVLFTALSLLISFLFAKKLRTRVFQLLKIT